jgi:DNA-binding NarL/FixJ family response regulator
MSIEWWCGARTDRFEVVRSRLMLVEDDQATRAMLRVAARVNRLGAVVAEAETSADAKRLAESVRPDVIVLDLYLHDAGGREVFHGVRAASPKSGIVVYTAFESQRDWYEQQGAPVVAKSASTDDLVRAIKEVTDSRPS